MNYVSPHQQIFMEFLNQYDYDVRKTHDARWIDQKCTHDVISIISDCILEFVDNSTTQEFTVNDIWHSQYARENVITIFSKPDPEFKAESEYDKYFSQPIKLLSYSKVLDCYKKGAKYIYRIANRKILQIIALRAKNANDFLVSYITKVLQDSGLYASFEHFFTQQDNTSYQKVRDDFIRFTINNTPINTEVECGRIFTKVLNPLAFAKQKKGTIKGRISTNNITLSDIQYNRVNWRDTLSGKEKNITRNEYLDSFDVKTQALASYTINKAKKAVKKYNDTYYNSVSEVIQDSEIVKATQAHHIFTQAEFPSIADYIENLIMLTPNQHYTMAHPDNKTQYIDKDFQYICLLAKALRIMENLTSESLPKFYDFDNYKFVLNTGLATNSFDEVLYLDFATILEKIDYFYSDVKDHNKYADLIDSNRINTK